MVSRFRAELEETPGEATIIGTGGYAHVIADEVGCFDAIEENLNLEGLRLVYEANQ
jgi:pantothenate kinase type III